MASKARLMSEGAAMDAAATKLEKEAQNLDEKKRRIYT